MALHSYYGVNNYAEKWKFYNPNSEIFKEETKKAAKDYIEFFKLNPKEINSVTFVEKDKNLPNALKEAILEELKKAAMNIFERIWYAIFG